MKESMTEELTYDDFLKIDVRVGTIKEAKDFPEARNPAFQLFIDFGKDIGMRKTSAQITKHYTKESLIGKQVAAVINFPKKQIGPFMSECLTLGFPDENGDVVLIQPERKIPNGGRLY